MPKILKLLFELSSRVEAALMAAAIAHSIAEVAPKKAMDYDSIFEEHMAKISEIIIKIGAEP